MFSRQMGPWRGQIIWMSSPAARFSRDWTWAPYLPTMLV